MEIVGLSEQFQQWLFEEPFTDPGHPTVSDNSEAQWRQPHATRNRATIPRVMALRSLALAAGEAEVERTLHPQIRTVDWCLAACREKETEEKERRQTLWLNDVEKSKSRDQKVGGYPICLIDISLKIKMFHIPFPRNVFISSRLCNKSQPAFGQRNIKLAEQ
jgi:hypothetical protein